MLLTMSESELCRIGILGAGNVGAALGARLAEVGYEVRFGVRTPAAPNESKIADVAAWAEALFVAVPAAAAVDAVRAAGDLDGKIVVDCTNPVGPGPRWAPPPAGSMAAAIAAASPGARVVKGWNTFGAEHHRTATIAGGPVDVLLAGDDAAAKQALARLARRAGFRPLDAGGLANAALLEAQALLWIHLAMRGGMGRNIAWRLVSGEPA